MSGGVDWMNIPMLGYDIESTGINPHEDRVIQAAVIRHTPGFNVETFTWLVNPGVPIPAEASEIHGITDEQVQAGGIEPAQAMFEISGHLALAMGRRIPIVIANAPYDLTMTEAENQRHGIDTLASRVAPYPLGPVIDPMVLDKHLDPFRKVCFRAPGCDPENQHHECGGCQGSGREAKRFYDCGGCGITDRKLTSLCRHYGIDLVDAHDAASDALAAVGLARFLLVKFRDQFNGLTVGGLHQGQVGWKAHQANELRKFFDKVGKEHDGVPTDWPILSTPVETAAPQGALL